MTVRIPEADLGVCECGHSRLYHSMTDSGLRCRGTFCACPGYSERPTTATTTEHQSSPDSESVLAARCVSLERALEHVRGRYKARCAELNAAEREWDDATEEYKKLYVKASRQRDELQGSLLAAATRLAEVGEFVAAKLAKDTAVAAREGQS